MGEVQQRTLYNLRRGGVKRCDAAADDERVRPVKRVKAGEHIVAERAEEEKEDEQRALRLHPGTTTDPSDLVPVTRAAFLDVYRVKDLSDVYYKPDWVSAAVANAWRRELDALPEWYRPTLRVYGRTLQQSRAIAAYATAPGLDLQYSGHQVDMHNPFPPVLERIAARLASADCLGSEVKFNHAMLNRYENGEVYIGKHSDNKENKVIVTVSLGAERSWIMEERVKKGEKAGARHRWTLANGSLLVMQGAVQQRYTHEIPKERKVHQPRISITFRQLVY